MPMPSSPRSPARVKQSWIFAFCLVTASCIVVLAAQRLYYDYSGTRQVSAPLLGRAIAKEATSPALLRRLSSPDPVTAAGPSPKQPRVALRQAPSHSRFHETLRAPSHPQPCGYAALATTDDDAIQSIALFRQFETHGMTECNFVLIVPRRTLAEQWPQHRTGHKELTPHSKLLCPIHTWLERLDVHVVLADVPFDAAKMVSPELQALVVSRFPAINIMKGIAIGLLEYDTVVYCDSDVLVFEPMPELHRLPSGTAAPGLVWGEPLNGGLFVVSPSQPLMEAFTAVFERSSWHAEHGFDSVWEGTGRTWNFSAAATDQGALYYLFKVRNQLGAYIDPFTYGYPACETRLPLSSWVPVKMVHFKGECKRVPIADLDTVLPAKPQRIAGGRPWLVAGWLKRWHRLLSDTRQGCDYTVCDGMGV